MCLREGSCLLDPATFTKQVFSCEPGHRMARTVCLERYWNVVFQPTTVSISQNNSEDRGSLVAGTIRAIFMCGDDGIELKGFAGYWSN